MKNIIACMLILICSARSFAQDTEMETVKEKDKDEERSPHRFKKENLFTGGGIQLSISNHNFGIGGSPVIGYSINKWVDAGLGLNYNYISQREVYVDQYGNEYTSGNKIHQNDIGPIAFARFYPLKFLYIQAQGEQNFITQKYIYSNGVPDEKIRFNATSLLLGVGYCGGRQGVGDLFYYVSLSVDVLKNKYSPYVQHSLNGDVNILPILKAGLQIPLFQGGRHRF